MESQYQKRGRHLQTQDQPTFEPKTQLDIWKGVTASVAKGMTTSRPRGVSRRRDLGLRNAQSSVTAQSQLVGALRPSRTGFYRETCRRHTDGRAVEREDKPGNHTQNSETRPGNWGPPSRDPTAGGSRKVHASCIGPWEQSLL